MIREAINELKKYTLGKKNTETVEINVLHLNRVIKALEQTDWIPIKFRSMTEEEIKFYKDRTDIDSTMIYDCRLPDDGEEVLVTTRWGVDKTTFFNDDEYGAYFEYYEDDGDVLAWMPLPEKWEGDKNEA